MEGIDFYFNFFSRPDSRQCTCPVFVLKKTNFFILLFYFIQNNSTSRSADRFAYMNINFFFSCVCNFENNNKNNDIKFEIGAQIFTPLDSISFKRDGIHMEMI
jgi:hypothetical protein